MLGERNVGESKNSDLERRGLRLDGLHKPRWVKTQQQMEWVAYARTLADTLSIVIEAEGTVAAVQAIARRLDVLSPPEPDDEMTRYLLNLPRPKDISA
jgi:hypothetical protein